MLKSRLTFAASVRFSADRDLRRHMFFFFFPINTDAPVYHFPWATLSLILANGCVFAASVAGVISPDDWALSYSHIAPLEWVTSNFVHAGMGHLLGNMVVLWGLGLIVEGKIGSLRFFVVYFGIAVSECAIEQAIMLGSEGGSLGASAVIFGLTAMALVWAPKNEISFFYFFWVLVFFRAGVFELTVMTYSAIVIAMEVLLFTIQGFHISSSALHLLGGAVGYGVGVFMLKRGMVDCEGWDLFSVLKGQNGRITGDPSNYSGSGLFGTSAKKKRRRRKKSRRLADSTAELASATDDADDGLSRTERGRRKILQHVADRKPNAAWAELQRQQHISPAFKLKRGTLLKLAQGLIEHEEWNNAASLLEEYIKRFGDEADTIRVQLAILLLHKQRRPQAALRALEHLDRDRLSEKLKQRVRKIEQLANEMIESGVIELSGQAFSSD